MTISASAVPRLLACPGSAHLRRADYQTAYADAGDERHADAEAAADLGGDLDPRVRAFLQPGDEMAAECSFAYDVSDDTGRGLGHLGGRRYDNLGPFEIPGTVDLLIRGTKRLLVVDYKSFEDVEPAERNAQLATYALMVARAAGLDEVMVAIIYLAAPWRPADVATLYSYDLDAHADRLRALMVGGDRSLRTGRHCKYCPSFHDCPEQKQLAADASGGALAVRVEAMIPFEQDDDAATAYELRDRLRMLLKRLEAGLYARSAERPIPLRNGKMFGPRDKLGNEKLDGDIVYQVAKAHHGQAFADEAVTRQATKKRLEEALKKSGQKVAPAMKSLLAEVKALGGVTQKHGTEFVEYEAGPRALPAETQDEPQEVHVSPF